MKQIIADVKRKKVAVGGKGGGLTMDECRFDMKTLLRCLRDLYSQVEQSNN